MAAAPVVLGIGQARAAGCAALARALLHLGVQPGHRLAGESMSSHWRAKNRFMSWWCGLMPAQAGGVGPPLLGAQVGAHHRRQGPLVPHGGGKTGVVAIGGDPAQRFAPPSQRTFLRPHRQPRGLRGLGGQVQRPVGIGQRQAMGDRPEVSRAVAACSRASKRSVSRRGPRQRGRRGVEQIRGRAWRRRNGGCQGPRNSTARRQRARPLHQA
jgi:hypothetical protein